MIRLILYATLLAAITAAASAAADLPGRVTVDLAALFGVVIELSVGGLILALLAVGSVAVLLLRAFGLLTAVPDGIRLWWERRRDREGYRAVSRGLLAAASGDLEGARRNASQAGRLLEDDSLALLLSAQAAQLTGDDAEAGRHFAAMAERQDTAFLGLRGLLAQAVRRDDLPEALRLARQAHALRPGAPWVLEMLFTLQVRAGAWLEARETLGRAVRAGLIAPGDGRRKDALLLLLRASDAGAAGHFPDMEAHLRMAHERDESLLPVTLSLADRLLQSGKHRQALKILERAWKLEPSHKLTPYIFQARQMAETGPGSKAKRQAVERLHRFRPDHIESRLARAELALDDADWETARRELMLALEQAPPTGPSARLCRLMARLEEGKSGNAAAARDWSLRAAHAAPEEIWRCGNCGAVSDRWQPLCAACGAFDCLAEDTPAPPGLEKTDLPGSGPGAPGGRLSALDASAMSSPVAAALGPRPGTAA